MLERIIQRIAVAVADEIDRREAKHQKAAAVEFRKRLAEVINGPSPGSVGGRAGVDMGARLSRRDRHAVRTTRVNSGFRIQASWPKRIHYALIGRQL